MTAPTITRQMVLRRAAEILQANGRNVETYYDTVQHEDDGVPVDNCRMCAFGAIAHAAGVNLVAIVPAIARDEPTGAGRLAIDAGHALAEHLGAVPPDLELDASVVILTIGDWNDDPARTTAQVIAALTDTADALDAQEAS